MSLNRCEDLDDSNDFINSIAKRLAAVVARRIASFDCPLRSNAEYVVAAMSAVIDETGALPRRGDSEFFRAACIAADRMIGEDARVIKN